MSDNVKKRGRPKKERKAIQGQYRLVMSDDMSRRLDDLSRLAGMTKADILREAFDRYEEKKLSEIPTPISEEDYWMYETDYEEENDDDEWV